MRIETDRLILRPLCVSDLDDLYQYQSDPETVRFTPWPARTREQVREAFDKHHVIPNFSEDGQSALLGWELKENGKVIGQSAFTLESITNQKGVLGYVMNPQFSGRGLAFEAVNGLIAYVFNNLQVRRLTATIDPRNQKSIALIERLGFHREATFIEDEFFKGEWIDTCIYALRKSEWNPVSG
jgi:RimJ/RimL family protein N-acetyltransferase